MQHSTISRWACCRPSRCSRGLGLPEAKGPLNIELFGGSPDDNNAYFFYGRGSMSVLKPLIDKGTLKVQSGPKWAMGTRFSTLPLGRLPRPQARMDNLLSAYYSDKSGWTACFSPYDGLSIGILSSLKGVGYGSGGMKMPIVTGQGRRGYPR